jgi:hypothetical protein
MLSTHLLWEANIEEIQAAKKEIHNYYVYQTNQITFSSYYISFEMSVYAYSIC